MSAVLPTRSGIAAFVARKVELLGVTWTLRWAEDDREFVASQIDALPKRLKAMDRDLELLRVRQAVLRNN